ncbi:MAG TPA: hypothetical protein VG389_26800 [Myxococcota bacterium]|jgi:hypothetical protein|nr:hypothetical protein [Myxococcota bacterium]
MDAARDAGGPPQCQNGSDDDGDGRADFPDDPGCLTPEDADETDPTFPPPCADGLDDDGDGRIDFPDDPGCTSAADDDETDAPLPPACTNGVDDDGDGRVDFPYDPECRSPDDPNEGTPPACDDGADNDGDEVADYPGDPGCDDQNDDDEWNPPPCGPSGAPVLQIPAGGVASGSIFGVSASLSSCGGGGAEVVYWLDPPGAVSELVLDTAGSGLDTAVYVRAVCEASFTELGCSVTPAQARLVLANPVPGPWFVFVDGRFSVSTGSFVLQVSATLAAGATCVPGDAVFHCPAGAACLDAGAGPVCVAGPCSNGLDDDGDALPDLADPGCAGPADADEVDPVPPPACANGVDDDGDAFADFPADPGCLLPGDDDEFELCPFGAEPADLGAAGGAASGFTSGGSAFTGSCGGGSSPEAVFWLDPPGPLGSLTVSTEGSLYDTVAYVRAGACGSGAEVGCADDGVGPAAVLVLDAPPPGRLWVFVDGATGGAGPYIVAASGVLSPQASCVPGDPVFSCNGPAGDACAESVPGAGDFACRPGPCADDVDDDGDGYAAFPLDLGCTSADDPNEGPDPACWNGIDDDGDLIVDYPFDCGCDSPGDADETDSPVPSACADGADEDGDAAPDFPADLGCAACSDDSEGDDACPGGAPFDATAAVLAASPAEASFTGVTAGASLMAGTCGGGGAPEAVYAVRLTSAYSVLAARTVSAGPGSYDTLLYARTACAPGAGAEIACNDDFPACCFSAATVSPALPGVYYCVVDGDGVAAGDYELRLSLTP